MRLRSRISNPTALIVNPVNDWLPTGWEYSERDDTFFNVAGDVVYDLSDTWTTTAIDVLENYSEDATQTLIEIGITETGNLSLITISSNETLLRTGYRMIYREEEFTIANPQPRYDLCFVTITRVGRNLSGNTI